MREELHDGVDGSTPPSRHVGSNHDPCRSLNRQGGFAGGCDSRRSAEILSGREAARARRLRVERDVRGSAGCAWAEPFAKLVKRVGQTTLVRGRRHYAIDAGITESTCEATLEDMSAQARLGSYPAVQSGSTAWILRICTPILVAARGYRARAMLGLHAPEAL